MAKLMRLAWRDRVRALKRDVAAIALAVRDPRVPWYAKAAGVCIAAYAMSAIDLIPDFVPVLGLIDDLVLVPLGLLLVARLIPADILAEHRAAAAAAAPPVSRRGAAAIVAVWVLAAALMAVLALRAFGVTSSTRGEVPRVMTSSIYEQDLDRNPANFQPLTPLTFLARAADVFARHTAIIHGARSFTYGDFYARSRRLASALAKHGVGRGDTVSVMLPNVPAMLEAHYGVAMTGAVLNSINTRLDAAAVAFILDHAETAVLVADREFSTVVKAALGLARVKPRVIDHDDPDYSGPGERLSDMEYEAFLQHGEADFAWAMPADEWDAIALNYTSGTTGDPKGVVYHHRGAYLLAMANVITCATGRHPVYLWTLPMFHCNGWCFPWTLSIVAGTHVCLRQVRAAPVYDAIARHRVTHLCGAPVVMSTLLNAKAGERQPLPHRVEFITAAAPPPEAVLAAMGEAGFNVTHVYGLTEVYGPACINEWHAAWAALPSAEQAALKARQGVRYPVLEGLDVLDPQTMQPVPHDGETPGEVMFRGNVVMRGYLKNKASTDKAFAGGWFHSGDLGVVHPDGYVQLKDRSKDIIISGGENISSIEVEEALYRHPAVQAAAVVARPDEKWGETPCAFVELKPDAQASADELIAWCRSRLASFKCPRYVVFAELPKTSTGKIQKFRLREMAKQV